MIEEEKDLELAQDKDYAQQVENEEPPFVEYDITTYPADYTLSVLFITSIFDSIFCIMMKHVDEITADIEARYYKLIENQEFVDLTTLATTDTKIVKRRFELVERELFG